MFDMIIIGAGPSGCFFANEYTKAGLRCLLLEAGEYYQKHTYPRNELTGNSKLYWSGGIELNSKANIGLLRPKAVGGGSIVNQALLDRFDDIAFDAWKENTGISFYSKESFEPYYKKVLEDVPTEVIPTEFRNENAKIFEKGFENNGYKCAPLTRAQSGCKYAEGNDCIECLNGCRINSKQSSAITVLPNAVKNGLVLKDKMQVLKIEELFGKCYVSAQDEYGSIYTYETGYITLASGAIGNTKILKMSGFGKKLPALGNNFYTHPQFMSLGFYDHPINSHKGPFQSMKSDDPQFRKDNFKLENVFGPPVALSMLIPKFGKDHLEKMKKITQIACVEVAIRDFIPGEIKVNSKGKVKIIKDVKGIDLETKMKGIKAIENIFKSTGAREIINGQFGIGLHLMGGCNIGSDGRKSVTTENFHLHSSKRVFLADSSIFPTAPGINPSLTIMAQSLMASEKALKEIS